MSEAAAPFVLRFTNNWNDRWTEEAGQQFFFTGMGDFWPSSKHPNRRLVRPTTRKRDEAKEFASVEEAREVIALTGATHFEIVDAGGRVWE
jgi:hypothetical protein